MTRPKKQVEDLMSKGWGGTVFLTTDDVQASYEELKGRGVEFTEAPAEQPYGARLRNSATRLGNKYRLGKPTV